MQNRQQIRERIKGILCGEKFMIDRTVADSIRGDTSLINDLALDSIQILELIVGLEQEFEFTCEPYELNIDMFDNLDELIDFIEKKLKQKSA